MKVEERMKAVSHLRQKQLTVSQMAVKMEEQEQLHKKRNHISSELLYEEYPASKDELKPRRKILNGCPCFICRNIRACGVGHEVSPISCLEIGVWAEELARRKKVA